MVDNEGNETGLRIGESVSPRPLSLVDTPFLHARIGMLEEKRAAVLEMAEGLEGLDLEISEARKELEERVADLKGRAIYTPQPKTPGF